MRMDDLLVTLETELGPIRLDIATEDRVHVEAGFFRQGVIHVDGEPTSLRTSIRLYDGEWHVNRTGGGNESKASLDVLQKGCQAGKRVRDRVRTVVLEAVRKYLAEHPGKLVLAKRERLVNELRAHEADLARAHETLKRVNAKRAAAMDELERMPQNLDSDGNPVSV